MNREIKFRAWDKSKNKMFYDVQETSCYWNGLFNPDVIQEDNFGYILDKKDVYEVMQFTGLYDMKKVPIYEGDIVRKELFSDIKLDNRVYNYAKVMWIEEFAGFYLVNKNNKILWEVSEDKYNIEVIGNLWENSDLLGE